jgi:CRISPR-associated protein Cas1
MIKRIIDISEGPTFLNIEDDQLILTRKQERIASIPCEDIGMLLVDHRQTTYTHSAMTRLLERGAAIVLCGEDHLPRGILLPLENNDLHTRRFRVQVAAKLPLRKQLWQQIVIHKVKGQAMNLPLDHPSRRRLLALGAEVKSGDTSNCEGVAARFYWTALMGEAFRRDPEGAWPNPLFNYGYMVFRAAVARAIVGAGLHPAIGLYHSHRNNPFVLADDLVEVFRPRIDRAVVGYVSGGAAAIDKAAKAAILSLLSEPITVGGISGPLMVGLGRMLASLVRCFEGTQKSLELPELQKVEGE